VSKKRRRQQKRQPGVTGIAPWLDDQGLHALLPGRPPSQELLDQMTKAHQERIRNSPLWDALVQEVGLEEAERMLQQFQVKIHDPGV